MTLKNKVLLGSWIVTASKVFRHDKMQGRNLPGRYDQRMLKECKIKMQPMYNYKNLYKLMRIALKLLNCRFKMTYFVKNHDILFNQFNENEEQTTWKHNVNCACKNCNSYFTEHSTTS